MTIKKRLIIQLLALTIVPLLTLGISSYLVGKNSLQQKILSSLEIIVDQKSEQISEFINAKRHAAQILKNSIIVNNNLPILIRYAGNFEHEEFCKATSELNKKLRIFQNIFQITDITLTDPQGKLLYLSNEDHSKKWRGHFLQIAYDGNQNREVIPNYFINEHIGGAYGILVNEPVISNTGELLGFVSLEIDIAPIKEVIADNTGLGEHGFSKLVKKISGENYICVATNYPGSHDVAVIPASGSEFGLPMQMALEGGSGSGAGFSCGENEVFAAWRHLSVMDMGIVSTIRSDEALISINRMRLMFMTITSVTLIASAFLAIFIFRSIASPLQFLQAGVKKIGEGDLDYRLNSSRNDEFGSLARSFDEMTQSLQRLTASRDELNQEVKERKSAVENLHKERTFLQNIIDGVVDPIMVIDTDYRVLLMNKAAQSNLPDKLTSEGPWFCYQASHYVDSECRGEDHPCPLKKVLKTGKELSVSHIHLSPDGGKRIYEIQASPLQNEIGQIIGIIESSRDITDRINVQQKLDENQERLLFLAQHDDLTNLPNRWLFNERLQQALSKANRSQINCAMLLLDLDRFKTINDTLGHQIGDQVLKEVATRLKASLRNSDDVARLGGDEFLVLIEGVNNISQIVMVVTKINLNLSKPIRLKGHELTANASIGISMFPNDAVDTEGLLKCADIAMYQAKRMGGNTYSFYTKGMNEQAHDRLYLEGQLRKALSLEQLFLVYQPQCDMRSGQILGCEALLRWQHPELGLVQPNDFIPLAEESGLIIPIGEWVLHTASLQNRQWQKQGYPAITMAVNISARQFRQPRFVNLIDQVLDYSGLDAKWLDLEITESIIMANIDDTLVTLADLKKRGLKLSIDDFGTGYSSLSYLKKFPIDKLKIDRSFINDLKEGNNDAAISTSIISLAKNMNLEVIAEGVETEDQKFFLIDKKCYQGQGFFFGEPLSPEVLASRLAQQVS